MSSVKDLKKCFEPLKQDDKANTNRYSTNSLTLSHECAFNKEKDDRSRSLTPPPRPPRSPFVMLKKMQEDEVKKVDYGNLDPLVGVVPWNDNDTGISHVVLRLNKDTWKKIRERSDKEVSSMHSVVGVIGDIHNSEGGRSIFNDLLSMKAQDSSFLENINDTISGMSYWKLPKRDNFTTLSFCNYRFEHDSFDLPNASPSAALKRKEHINYDMRRLAYASSHLLIYIIEDEALLDEDTYLDLLAEFTISSSEGIENSDPPSLLIIHANKPISSPADLEAVNAATAEFLSNSDQVKNSLQAHFYDVKTLVLPRIGSTLYDAQLQIFHNLINEMIAEKLMHRKKHGNQLNERTWLNLMYLLVRELYVFDEEGEDLILNQVDMGSLLLKVMVGDKSNLTFSIDYFAELRRRMKKTLTLVTGTVGTFPHQKLSLANTSRKFSDRDMRAIYSFMEEPNSENISLLSNCISSPTEFSMKNFVVAMKTASLSLVYSVLKESLVFLSKDFIDIDVFFHETKRQELWSHQLEPKLKLIYNLCMQYAPCGAVMNCKSLCSPIACDQTNKTHHAEWHYSEFRYALEENQSLSNKITTKLKKGYFGMKSFDAEELQINQIPAQWQGEYCLPIKQQPPSEELLLQFAKKYYFKVLDSIVNLKNDLSSVNKIIRAYQIALVNYAYSSGQLPGLVVKCSDNCACCGDSCQSSMSSSTSVPLPSNMKKKINLSCSHHLCVDCMEMINSSDSNLPPDVKKEDIVIEKVAYVQCYDRCPFCKASLELKEI